MRRLHLALFILFGLSLALPAAATQISVPSAPGAGYGLISSSTGNYIASSTARLLAGSNITLTGTPYIYASGDITISATGGGGTFPFTVQSYGNSTSTVIAFLQGLISNGSTTISGLSSGVVGNNNGLLYGFASSSLFGYTPLNPTRLVSTTYPLQGGGDLSADRTLTIAFGTTTSNTWAGTQTFTNSPILGSLSGIIYGNSGTLAARATTTASCSGAVSCTTFDILGSSPITINGTGVGSGLATSAPISAGQLTEYSSAGAGSVFGISTSTLSISGPFVIPNPITVVGSNGAVTYTGLATTSQPSSSNLLVSNGGAGVYGVATSAPSLSAEFGYSGTLGSFVGGANGTLSLATNGIAYSKLAQASANTVLGNPTGATANVQAFATSSLFTGTTGQVDYYSGSGALLGTSSIFIASSQNVGVGTTTPQKMLHVYGNQSGGIARFERRTAGVTGTGGSPSLFGTQDIAFSDTGSGHDFLGPTQTFSFIDSAGTVNTLGQIGAIRTGADNTGNFDIYANSAGSANSILTVAGNGVVAVGSSTPSNAAASCGNFGFCVVNQPSTGPTTAEAQIKLVSGTSTDEVRSFFTARSNITPHRGEIGSETNNDFGIYSNNLRRINISSTGSVSIGDATAVTFDPLNGLNALSNYPLSVSANSTTNSTTTGLAFSVSNTSTNVGASLLFNRTGSNDQGELRFYTKNSTVSGDNPLQAMVIDNAQRTGIGTTSPFARLAIHANPNDAVLQQTLFAIGSSTASATTTLFSVSNTGNASTTNLTISGQGASSGSNCLQVDTSGNVTKTGSACGGAGSTPGGSDKQVQFNDGGSTFNGASLLNYDKTNVRFGIGTSTPSLDFSISSTTPITTDEYVPATSTSMTIGMASSTNMLIRLGTSATTITYSSYKLVAGQKQTVTVCNSGSTAGALTWSNVHWSGGVAPGNTTTANQCDMYFMQTTSGTTSPIIVGTGMVSGIQ